jgi:hypothetical protein
MTVSSKSKQEYIIERSIVGLSGVEPEKVIWNWKPYLPQGKVVIIDGDGGVGKTSLLLDIVARMTTGRDMPHDSKAKKGGAVYVSFEDGIADTIVPRLRKMNADLTKIVSIKDVTVIGDDGIDIRPFSLADDIPLLRHAVESVDAKVVIVDPIFSALEGSIDSYKDQAVRRALSPLVSFAEETGVTVVMVRHFTKQGTDNLRHKGVGSLAFTNVARVGLVVMPDKEEDGVMLLIHEKHNLSKEAKPLRYSQVSDVGDEDTVYIKWHGFSELSRVQIMSLSKPSELRQSIFSTLADGGTDGLALNTIAMYLEQDGYKAGTTKQTVRRMLEEKAIEQTARGKYRLLQAVA